MPRKPPPPGALTAGQAAKILGVSTGMLTIYVRQGKLHRIGPESRTYKFYDAEEVYALAAAENAFFKAKEESTQAADAIFDLARPEDMDGVYELAVRLFGRAASADQRRAWLAKEARGHYVVRRHQDGKIVASVYLLPIRHDRMMAYMRDEIRARDLTADDILTYEPGVPCEVLVGSIASDPDTDQEKRSAYVAVLLRGVYADLERLGHEGIVFSRIYAWSETPLGIQMALNLEMRQWAPPAHGRHTFYLDVAESDAFLLQGYKKGFATWRREHPEQLVFSRATPEDMDGVYAVAEKLFEHTTSAADRKPLVERCPDGNYILKEAQSGVTLAYLHLQPLKSERLQAFLRGEIRGWQLTADDLDCFEPGKAVDVLVKSTGATRAFGEERSRYYMQHLLRGTARALAELGRQGMIIRRIYATSETESGINLAMHAKMRQIGRISPERYAFVLDVASSDLPLLKGYQEALAEWQREHPGQAAAVPVAKSRKRERPFILDWISPADMSAVVALDHEVFADELVGDSSLYSAWVTHNPRIAMAAYDKQDRSRCLAYISMLPLPEPIILDILAGKRDELSVRPEEIETYTRAGTYTLLANSAVVRPDQRHLLYAVLDAIMRYWVEEQYPTRTISKIYAQAASTAGDIFIQKFFFAPLYQEVDGKATAIKDGYVLDLSRPGASKVIRAFQEALAKKQAESQITQDKLSPLPELPLES